MLLQTLSSAATQELTSNRIIKALTLPQTDRNPFPFLKLPLELRDLIYHYVLTSSPLRTDRYHRWLSPRFRPDTLRNRAQPSLNLLLTNHQIYNEASRVLYYEGCFIIPGFFIRQIHFFVPSEDQLSRLDLTALDNKWYRHIRNIEIEIRCLGCSHPVEYGWHGSLEKIESILAGFPHLRTITVAWQSYTETQWILDADGVASATEIPPHSSMKRWHILKQMQSLRSFGQSHPAVKIMVQMPANELVFTKRIKRHDIDMDLAEFMARNGKRGGKSLE